MKFVAVFFLITIKKGGASVAVDYCFVFFLVCVIRTRKKNDT